MGQQTLWDSVTWHVRSWDEIRKTSLFTLSNYVIFFLFIALVIGAVYQATPGTERKKVPEKINFLEAPDFPPVETLHDFDWRKTEPLKFRPFKPKYHLTMALETLDPSELLVMDKNYEDRIHYRRRILKEHHDVVVAINDHARIRPAIREMYNFVFGTYLPMRYPSMFKLHDMVYETGQAYLLQNMITGELIPAQAKGTQSITLLETLGKHIDEDFLFLLPEENVEKDPKFILEAFVTICPSGFNPREKLGLKLSNIHDPVPAYADKLEGSMDRFFAKLEVGKYVRRVNWSITTGTELYAAGDDTNHAHEGDEVQELKEIDIDQTYQRSERQTLHRLPESQALVFAFKTYLYPIKDVKDEGLGENLAQAIDGLKSGNAPQMHFYKRGAVWGEAVKKYLRN